MLELVDKNGETVIITISDVPKVKQKLGRCFLKAQTNPLERNYKIQVEKYTELNFIKEEK